MSGSFALHDAWLLLKDYKFHNIFDEDYIENLRQRMNEYRKGNAAPLEHASTRLADERHYSKRKAQRFKDQRMPKGFEKFTPEAVATFMANDLISNYPQIKDAMGQKMLAPDKNKGEQYPGLSFEVFRTDTPVIDKTHGSQSVFTPIFVRMPDGKVGLKTVMGTVAGGRPNTSDRHTIHATPTTHPATQITGNDHIHPDLPARFDFKEARETDPQKVREPPQETTQPQEEDLQTKFANIPPGYRQRVIDNYLARRSQNDEDDMNIETGEPMDVAWRMLKGDVYAV